MKNSGKFMKMIADSLTKIDAMTMVMTPWAIAMLGFAGLIFFQTQKRPQVTVPG